MADADRGAECALAEVALTVAVQGADPQLGLSPMRGSCFAPAIAIYSTLMLSRIES